MEIATPAQTETPRPVAPEPTAGALAAAAEILKTTSIREGYCVDLAAGTGDLAHALARQSKLHIYAVEADPATNPGILRDVGRVVEIDELTILSQQNGMPSPQLALNPPGDIEGEIFLQIARSRTAGTVVATAMPRIDDDRAKPFRTRPVPPFIATDSTPGRRGA